MISQRVEDLSQEVNQMIESAWTHDEYEQILKYLSDSLHEICAKSIHIGTKLDDQTPTEQVVIDYEWFREFKKLATLFRDVTFQLKKGLILQIDNQADSDRVEKLFGASHTLLTEAAADFESASSEMFGITQKSEKEQMEWVKKKKQRRSPYQVLEEQIRVLGDQGLQFFQQYSDLKTAHNAITNHKEEVTSTFRTFKDEIASIESIGSKVKDLISDAGQTNFNQLPAQLETMLPDQQSRSILNRYSEQTSLVYSLLKKKITVPIALHNQEVIFKDIDFVKLLRVWIEGTVQPLFTEAQEVVDSARNNLHLNLLNVKDRISGMLTDNSGTGNLEADKESLQQPLNTILIRIEEDRKELEVLERQVDSVVNESFKFSNIYRKDTEFFDEAQQNLIDQLRAEEEGWIPSIVNWVANRIRNTKSIYDQVAEEESFSTAEKVIRYVKVRSPQEENFQYNNLFSVEGFMGESFWVGREMELERIATVISDWHDGYRGSVVLSGMRFCGKSVFGEIVANRFFEKNTLRIKTNSTLKIKGRQLDTKEDLGQVLEFVRKHSVGDKYLIWIDDIDLWHSHTVPRRRNIEALINYIDDSYRSNFFMVSCSNWVLDQLDQVFNFSNAFQLEINLDTMAQSEISRAISIRHGATHKTLLDEEGNRADSEDFDRYVSRIIYKSQFNIGDALNRWASHIHRRDDRYVEFKPKPAYAFPEILNEENRLLIRALLINKHSSEYELRKSFGNAFLNKYQPIIQRLMGQGILIRNAQSQLELNSFLANELARQLHQDTYINCKR